jgi:uncharacterized protein (DUF4415 family)
MSIDKSRKTAKRSSVSSRPGKLARKTIADIRSYKPSARERETLRRMAEEQARGDDSSTDYSDIPPLTAEQAAAAMSLREFRRRTPVSVRLDPRVLTWLKSKGPGHLTRINDILLNLMEAEKKSA